MPGMSKISFVNEPDPLGPPVNPADPKLNADNLNDLQDNVEAYADTKLARTSNLSDLTDVVAARAALGFLIRTIESFGTNVGTGDVTADTAAFQAAITWLNGGIHRVVVLSTVVYRINEVLGPITTTDWAIIGAGKGATAIQIPTGVTTVGQVFDIRGIRGSIIGMRLFLAETTSPAAGWAFVLDGAIDFEADVVIQGFGGLVKVGETTKCQRCRFRVGGSWNADLGLPVIKHNRAVNFSYDGGLNGVGTKHTVDAAYIELHPSAPQAGYIGMDTAFFNLTLQYIPASADTVVASGSNGVALPTGTINVDDTTGIPASGQARITTPEGSAVVTYTGKTGTTFTGCTGGTGTLTTGYLVRSVYPSAEGYWYGVKIILDGTATLVNQWFSGSTIDHWTAAGVYYVNSGTAYSRHLRFEDMRVTGDPTRSSGVAMLWAHNSIGVLQSIYVGGAWNFAGSRAAVISGGNDLQRVIVRGDGGTFTLSHNIGGSQTTSALAATATATDIRTALEANSHIGTGNVKVFGGSGGIVGTESPFFVLFCGALANTNIATMTADATSLTASSGSASVDVASLADGQAVDNIKSFDMHGQFEDICPTDAATRDAAVTLAAENVSISSGLDRGGTGVSKTIAFLETVKDIQTMTVLPAPRQIVGTTPSGGNLTAKEISHFAYTSNSEKRIVVPGAPSYGDYHGDRLVSPGNFTPATASQYIVATPFIPNVRVFTGIMFRIHTTAAGVGNVESILYDEVGNIIGAATPLSVSGTGAGTLVMVPFTAKSTFGPGIGFMSLSFDDLCPIVTGQHLVPGKVVIGGYGSEANPLGVPTTPVGTHPVMTLY